MIKNSLKSNVKNTAEILTAISTPPPAIGINLNGVIDESSDFFVI